MGKVWIVMHEEDEWFFNGECSESYPYKAPSHVFSTKELAKDFQKSDPKLYVSIIECGFD